MNDERTRRVGQNEALYRQVNERIEGLNETFASLTGNFDVVCECGELECADQISVSREQYERVRADPGRFIVRPGHEETDLERPVEDHGAYIVIEKHGGVPTRLAQQTDPRAKGTERKLRKPNGF
jgi:hypothetical protein